MESKSELIKPVDLECVDLQKYLRSKASAVIETLYNHPSICLAVYRELPEIARQFVIRILFVEQPVPQAVIASWTSQLYSKEHSLATSTLSELMIWRSVAIPGYYHSFIQISTYLHCICTIYIQYTKYWNYFMININSLSRPFLVF